MENEPKPEKKSVKKPVEDEAGKAGTGAKAGRKVQSQPYAEDGRYVGFNF